MRPKSAPYATRHYANGILGIWPCLKRRLPRRSRQPESPVMPTDCGWPFIMPRSRLSRAQFSGRRASGLRADRTVDPADLRPLSAVRTVSLAGPKPSPATPSKDSLGSKMEWKACAKTAPCWACSMLALQAEALNLAGRPRKRSSNRRSRGLREGLRGAMVVRRVAAPAGDFSHRVGCRRGQHRGNIFQSHDDRTASEVCLAGRICASSPRGVPAEADRARPAGRSATVAFLRSLRSSFGRLAKLLSQMIGQADGHGDDGRLGFAAEVVGKSERSQT